MTIEELNIPMPWGFVSAKCWGDSRDKPVLVAHGRMDNAGSFDRIIPLLPKSFYYICIDLPSHGNSSHLPPFFPIHTLDFVMVFKMVLDYLKRGKYIIFGHSFGAGIGVLFSVLYPEYVDKLIVIDSFAVPIEPKVFKDYLLTHFNSIMEIYQKQINSNRPTYTKQELVEKISNGRMGVPLPEEAAIPLMERVIIPAGNDRFYISTDQRMKFPLVTTHDLRYIKDTIRLYPVTCPYLLIVCEESFIRNPIMKGILAEIKKWNKIDVRYVKAGHDVHMTHPEMVAPIISQFLLKSESKL